MNVAFQGPKATKEELSMIGMQFPSSTMIQPSYNDVVNAMDEGVNRNNRISYSR